MIPYILRRLLQLIPVLLIASFAIWGILFVVPGGPVGALVGENATPEQIAAVTAELGLDRPFYIQYADWLWHAVQGDFGISIYSKQPVTALVFSRLPATLELALVAITFALIIGIPIAILSAMYPGSWLDRILSAWSALALGVPTFWVGILMILLFAVYMRWLPSASQYVSLFQDPLTAMRFMLMPGLTLGIYVSGVLARFLRASLITEMRSDYVRTARSKGMPGWAIMRRHIMPNAMLPFITVVALMIANFVAGAVVTESVFTYPGIGRLLVGAIETRDYPLIQGCIMIILVMYVLINLMVDILYAYVDPRVSLS